MDKLDVRQEASLILGFRLPDDPLRWDAAIKKNSESGFVDMNKYKNLIIMLLMRLDSLEKSSVI